MATPQASAPAPASTATQAKAKPPAKMEEITLSGDLCEFNLGNNLPNRRYFFANMKYGAFRQFFRVEPYDPTKKRGEQRNPIPSHVNALYREMKNGNFTPACLAGGVREAHVKNMTIVEGKKPKVTLKVFSNQPLPTLDGGHRSCAIEKLRADVNTDEWHAMIDNIDMLVQIYIVPELIKKDFRNLNAGKAVSRSQIKMMREEDLIQDPNEGPSIRVMQQVVAAMNRATFEESFLSEDINYTGTGGGHIDYSSVTATNPSDLATSIAGGVKIVLYNGFANFFKGGDKKQSEKLAAEFLTLCYMSAWKGIFEYGKLEEIEDQMGQTTYTFPELLLEGNMMRPNKYTPKGTKSGSGLNIMIGNMLAFRMLNHVRSTEIKPEHVEQLIAAVEETLCGPLQGGGSGTAKREATGEFLREYFKDVIRTSDDDEGDESLVGEVEGVPQLLCDHILTPSTCGVSSKAERKRLHKAKSDEDLNPPSKKFLSDPDQTDEGFDDEVGEIDIEDEEVKPKDKVRKKTETPSLMG